ncbi:MAG: sulfurtransferase-like selenium metabolism protein YedF [Clostridia bacterium]|nr:sulfurtransferase-like selenium metabolism protein YedF [Clostridia bacterium]
MIQVNALGADGSTQIEKAGEAIQALGGPGRIRMYVNSPEDAESLLDYASKEGLAASFDETTCSARCAVNIEVPEGFEMEESEETGALPQGTLSGRNVVVVISDAAMGVGDEEFGRELLRSFLYAVSRQDKVPHTFIFYNSAVHLTCEDSPELEDLRQLEQEGVQIISGDSSLKQYGLNHQLKVGRAANMYEITDILIEADHVLKP